ncbi:endonuclease domain-containing protein [Mycolicibacterium brumae]|uniref:endonuclease domain-containing protein n=1 Tax=Mycolicibacterium brumae TaxID=85968 RepID=UPI000FF9853A|nr:hypothetical protein [Mycolicibacterium brumae]MCV7194589.1 hypothetical protein [Mycolicibacterium brumae]RWA22973.1 hypothetical protein MBRU_11580 [Mycolicibacterium brumae DSM 44177]UWW08928.1 hypothetical protein L2Z93_002006 [Mycolicibacterium brumae]
MTRDPGIYSHAQLRERGYDIPGLRRGVASGDLIRLRHGWFAIRTHDPEAAAAVKAGGALACVSAMRWHGLWVPPGYAETHIRRTRRSRGRGLSCSAIGGPYPVTGPVDPVTLALACAARCMTAEDWVASCDSHLSSVGIDAAEFLKTLGHPGDSRLKKLLAMTDPSSQSGTESIARVRLKALGYHVISQPSVPGVGHVDLRVGALLIECDSVQHHTDLAAYQRDRARDRKAVVAGWITFRLTYDDVLYGWDETLRDIRAVTGRGRHRARGAQMRGVLAESLQADAAESAARRAAAVEAAD